MPSKHTQSQSLRAWQALKAGNARALRRLLPDWMHAKTGLSDAVSRTWVASRRKFSQEQIEAIFEFRLWERYGSPEPTAAADAQRLVQRAHFDSGVTCCYRLSPSADGPLEPSSLLSIGSGVGRDALGLALAFPSVSRSVGFDIDRNSLRDYECQIRGSCREQLQFDGRGMYHQLCHGSFLEMAQPDFLRDLEGHNVLNDRHGLEKFAIVCAPHPNPFDWLHVGAAGLPGQNQSIRINLDRLQTILTGVLKRLESGGRFVAVFDHRAWRGSGQVSALLNLFEYAGFEHVDVPATLFFGMREPGAKHQQDWLLHDGAESRYVGAHGHLSRLLDMLGHLRALGSALAMTPAQDNNLLNLLVPRHGYLPAALFSVLADPNGSQAMLINELAQLGTRIGFRDVEAIARRCLADSMS